MKFEHKVVNEVACHFIFSLSLLAAQQLKLNSARHNTGSSPSTGQQQMLKARSGSQQCTYCKETPVTVFQLSL